MYTILINAGEYCTGIFQTKEEAEAYLKIKHPYSLHPHTVVE